MIYRIYVDDVRPCPTGFDKHCYTTNETLNVIRKQYKAGVRRFFLDLDHDAGSFNTPAYGGDYINILKAIEDLKHAGKFSNDCEFYAHLHTMNPVGKDNMRTILNGPYFTECNWVEEK